jgi:hypothetical protein
MEQIRDFSIIICSTWSDSYILSLYREIETNKSYNDMSIENLIESGVNVNVTLSPKELIEVIDYVVQKTKTELEDQIISQKQEVYFTSKEVSGFLKVDNSTLWRWEKRGYLKPIYIGGKKRYPKSEIVDRFTSINKKN